MKRWLPWFAIAFVMAGWIVIERQSGSLLLDDSDTKVLLEAIAQRDNPLAWFVGDWPLENHFYRPISTLFFEFDYRVHGGDPAGYGLTNALICALCVLLAFWVIREITRKDWVAGFGASLFGLWHVAFSSMDWLIGSFWILSGLTFFGLIRGGKGRLGMVVIGALALIFAGTMFYLPGGGGVASRVMNWIPGRTATSMTIFCLLAMGAWGRFLNLSSSPKPVELTSTDLPATKGSVVQKAGIAWPWLVFSLVGLVLALGAYEQAVMVAAVLTGMALLRHLQGNSVRWGAVALPWIVTAGYWILRKMVLPGGVSGYQAQQFRSGPGIFWDLVEYFTPFIRFGRDIVMSFESGPILWLTSQPWIWLILFLANLVGIWAVWKDRDRWLILFAQSGAFISFLPMAWLKYFGHYLYWPMMFWAMYAVLLVPAMLRRWVIAISPPALQAPPRSDP